MSSKTILLVEDSRSDIDLTIRAFKKAQIKAELVVAEDGEKALEILISDDQRNDGRVLPALVLMDVNLPKMDGFEVLKAIRGNSFTHNLPVIFLTSSTEESDIKEAYYFGANSYIRKPVDFHQFSTVIQSLGNYWLTINEIPPG